jgi:hypothetical protein
MHRTLRAGSGAALVLICAVCLGGAAPPAAPPAQSCINQSPRRLDEPRPVINTSLVAPGVDDTLFYTPPTGAKVKLSRCGQHYHCEIENFQGCPGQQLTLNPPQTCRPVPLGGWIEIHTVYAAGVERDQYCDPETLNCCKTGPYVVMAYHAKVVGPTVPAAPVPVLWGLPAFEWSGSNTGWDPPGACKTTPAHWSFIRGFNFTVSESQLRVFRHADAARRLQPAARLSNDLMRVEKPQ